ncbi:TetR/AcrR family transcriptional regulator [Archangium violaceum]|uniref:TetR/AcrR family transcriptional regulator n=1 Tax=Archangium violaceum TaxID=83451 RepID=UPI00194FB51D|nr:TetR/AcrR family transcriptional regulator [Archangium violaceum]QRN95082.1 TetR/AcrR family transcriptional regulator [Archangium violaceum]
MPRTPQQYQQLKEERRSALLKAAREVFARRGLAATKMTDLAAAAGISYGLVYHYFPDKESVFATLVEEAIQDGIRLLTAERQGPGTPWEQLQRFCAQILEHVREETSIPLILVQARASESIPAPVQRALERYTTQFFQQLVELIEAGQSAGQIVKIPAAELARLLLSTVQGLALTQVLPRPDDAPFPATDTVLRLFRP